MKEIKIQVARGENFTPASLMKRYADQADTEFRRSFWGAAELVIEGRTLPLAAQSAAVEAFTASNDFVVEYAAHIQ